MIELGCRSVTVELASVDRLDAAYLRALRTAQKRLRRDGGQLTVVLARPELTRILALTGVCGGLGDWHAPAASSRRNVRLDGVEVLGVYHQTGG